MNRVAVGTIVAKNYLSFARVLGRSLKAQHPEVPFFVVLTDELEGAFEPGSEPFEIVPLAALGVPDRRRVCFQYSRLQVTIVAKPYLLRYLLDRGFDAGVFLDADILVLDRLDSLFTASVMHPVTLTPHLLAPLAGTTRVARELNILQSGVYNGGFIGVSDTPTARQFLKWWSDRLQTHCRHAVADGMHYDQRWLDLAPVFFEDVGIVRDPSCNVAYWNLAERHVEIQDGAVLAGGGPCRFFHFSGFDPDRPRAVTRYWPSLMLDAIGPAAALFERYVDLLQRDGCHVTKAWPYAYECFDNGVAIPEIARRMHLELDGAAEAFGDPFRTAGPDSYFAWLNEAVTTSSGVTRLWAEVYRSRADLRHAFPDALNGESATFSDWILSSGGSECSIPDAFLPRPVVPTLSLEQGQLEQQTTPE